MSDTSTAVDSGTTESVVSTPVAPPTGGDQPGSTPASVDTTAQTQAPPSGEEPRQSRREARAFAAQRREIRERDRYIGRLEAMLETSSGKPQGQPGEGDQPPQQRQITPAERAAQERNDEIAATVVDRLEEAGEQVKGFDKVMETITDRKFPMTAVMRDFLAETDKPAEMAVWMSENRDEARRISLLSDAVAVRALEKAEARLSAKPAPKTSQAPPPVPTVSGRSTPDFDPNKAGMDEYAQNWHARREKNGTR